MMSSRQFPGGTPRKLAPLLAFLSVLAACGGSSHPAAAPGTQPAASVPAGHPLTASVFCDRLNDLTDATGKVGIDTRLADVRRDFPQLVRAAGSLGAVVAPVGSGLQPALGTLGPDARTVNRWIQSQATQKDLDHNHQPAAVSTPFARLRSSIGSVEQWATRNCDSGPD